MANTTINREVTTGLDTAASYVASVTGSIAAGGSYTITATSHGTAGPIICNVKTGVEAWRTLATGTLCINATVAISTEKLYINGGVNIADTGILTWAGALKNIRIGNTTCAALTSGTYNVAIGESAMGLGIVTGNYNVALGAGSLEDCTSGSYNTSFGWSSAKHLTTGTYTVSIGYSAMGVGIVTGADNIALGTQSLENCVAGNNNISMGYWSGLNLSSGAYNFIAGWRAMGQGVVTGTDNIAIGRQSSEDTTSAAGNVMVGFATGYNLTSGSYDIAIGYSAMGFGIVTGSGYNVSIGYQTMYNSTTVTSSIAIGKGAMSTGVVTGADGIGIGQSALNILTSGADNIGIGRSAGVLITTGAQNTYVGALAGSTGGSAATLTKSAAFGYNALVSASSTMVFGGTGADAVAVCIGATAAVGTELLYVAGAIRGTGTAWLGCPAAAPADATLTASQVTWSVNESTHNLTFKVKYADGTTVKSGSVALT